MIKSSKSSADRLNYDDLPKIIVNENPIGFGDSERDFGYQLNWPGSNDDTFKTIMRKAYCGFNSVQPLKKILNSDFKLQLVLY